MTDTEVGEETQEASFHEDQILSDEAQEQRPTLEPKSRGRLFISRHWRGECPLAESFWVNTIVVWLLLFVALAPLRERITEEWMTISPRVVAAFFVIWMGLLYAILLWQLVGLWRSARAHFVRTQRAFWGGAVQFLVVLTALSVVSSSARVLPLVEEYVQIALGRDDFRDFTVRVILGGNEVAVEGFIGFGLTQEVKRYLDRNPGVQIVRLDSPGGWMAEAHKLGQLVESRHLSTYTSQGCFSACTSAFLAGSKRILNPDARLGFHQGQVGRISSDWLASKSIEREKAYFLSRGVNKEFVRKAFSTPYEKMWIPLPGELLLAKVITHVSTDTDDLQE